jgi:hypothetical protein
MLRERMPKRRPGDWNFYDEVETGMVSGFMIDRATLAIQKAMKAKMDDEKWLELGYELNKLDMIENHPRLLRALRFGDDDYGGHIFRLIPELLGTGLENLKTIEDYLDLADWLKRNEPKLYAELYDGQPESTVPLEQVEEASGIHDVGELNRHAKRIRDSIEEDPEQALGSAKELLETVLKTVVGEDAEYNDEISDLLKKARQKLDLDPKAVDAKAPSAEALKRTLSSLGQIVQGVAEVRNLHGTGHGRVNSHELETAHARLVVNSAVTISTFLLEVWQDGQPPRRNRR